MGQKALRWRGKCCKAVVSPVSQSVPSGFARRRQRGVAEAEASPRNPRKVQETRNIAAACVPRRPLGAVVGGLLIGLIEAFTAGFISSGYKEASPFLVIILVLIFMPDGLFGRSTQERV